MKTIVKVYLRRDPRTGGTLLLVENLRTREFHGINESPELLGQVHEDEHEACFEAEWDGLAYTFGRRVPEPRAKIRILH